MKIGKPADADIGKPSMLFLILLTKHATESDVLLVSRKNKSIPLISQSFLKLSDRNTYELMKTKFEFAKFKIEYTITLLSGQLANNNHAGIQTQT